MQKQYVIVLANTTMKKKESQSDNHIFVSDRNYVLGIGKVPHSFVESSNGRTISFN